MSYLRLTVDRTRFPLLDPTFFPGRAASIYYRAPPPKESKPRGGNSIENKLTELKDEIKGALKSHHHAVDVEIGKLGILHPEVLEKFEIGYPCSALEFSLEPFKKKMPSMWTNDE